MLVIKLGGSLLRARDTLDAAARALGAVAARGCRALVVPGGGAFADAVRSADAALALGDDAAHWAATLAMDQCAHVVAGRVPGAEVVDGPEETERSLARRRLPVLAPYRWLRAADPLPHSWDVTSDSIAAWVAGQLGARPLVLVKTSAGAPDALADPYFARALPAGVEASVLAAADLARLAELCVDVERH